MIKQVTTHAESRKSASPHYNTLVANSMSMAISWLYTLTSHWLTRQAFGSTRAPFPLQLRVSTSTASSSPSPSPSSPPSSHHSTRCRRNATTNHTLQHIVSFAQYASTALCVCDPQYIRTQFPQSRDPANRATCRFTTIPKAASL